MPVLPALVACACAWWPACLCSGHVLPALVACAGMRYLVA